MIKSSLFVAPDAEHEIAREGDEFPVKLRLSRRQVKGEHVSG